MSIKTDGGSASPRLEVEDLGAEWESDVEDGKIDEVKMGCEGHMMAVDLSLSEKVSGEREMNVKEVDVDIIGGVNEMPPPVVEVDDIPEEVWLTIFETLDPSDMRSCYRTSPKWRAFLSYKRTFFLFLEVAPLLLGKVQNEDLLNCRNVCSAWKKGFDDAYQAHPQNLSIGSNSDPEEEEIQEVFTTFSSGEQIQEFLRDMEGHPGNPFPGRNIVLECPQDYRHLRNFNDQLYRESVIQLMDTFGHHIYFADLDFDEFDTFNLNMREILQDCLSRLPNLKRLYIFGDDSGIFQCHCDYTFLGGKTFPRLVHLESLSLVGGYYCMNSQILTLCCEPQNIKRLLIEDNGEELYDIVYNFHNLQVLHASLTVEDLERFGILQQPPSLRQVEFTVFNSEYPYEVDCQRVFTALQLFSNSLEDVTVAGYGSGCREALGLTMDPLNKYQVKLPKLRKLQLENYDGPLEPLFQLSSLSHLDIKFVELATGAGSADVVYGIENQLYRTNIWNMLPCLKTLVISRNYRNGRYREKTYDHQSYEYEMYEWKG